VSKLLTSLICCGDLLCCLPARNECESGARRLKSSAASASKKRVRSTSARPPAESGAGVFKPMVSHIGLKTAGMKRSAPGRRGRRRAAFQENEAGMTHFSVGRQFRARRRPWLRRIGKETLGSAAKKRRPWLRANGGDLGSAVEGRDLGSAFVRSKTRRA